MRTGLKMLASALITLVVLGTTLFWPAGTFNYWQGWVFIAVFALATTVPSLYLNRKDPAAIQRRMHAGPRAETRTVQKLIMAGAISALIAMVVFSALDHRFGWSRVPAAVSVLGDVMIAAGIGLAMLVIAQNSYAAATVRVEQGQTLASGGLYRLVRHPMYAGNVIMMLGLPLALGSYWGLVFVVPGIAVLILRILDEENLLTRELAGYRDYAQRVRYRLLPYVW